MDYKEVRWQQRFTNYKKALKQLAKFVQKGEHLNELEETGMIKAFEYTYELAWNTMKDFYEDQGEAGLQGGRDTIELAFKRGLIKDGAAWMAMLKDRNRTVHTYNEAIIDEIAGHILNSYFGCYIELKDELEKIVNKDVDLFNN
jgi:nucleotidyltransferase substrate binding protein (TIGR01987 family)